jgi:hypothetical protein
MRTWRSSWRILLAGLAVGTFVSSASAAHAASVDPQFVGTFGSESVDLDLTVSGGIIISAMGSLSGPISGDLSLVAPVDVVGGGGQTDNNFNPSNEFTKGVNAGQPSYFDNEGADFVLISGLDAGDYVNIFEGPGDRHLRLLVADDISTNKHGKTTGDILLASTADTSFSVTPLPSTWIMMLTGLVGFGLFAYRQQKFRTSNPAA